MAGPFKMKGSPMQRNFGIGSPMKQDKKKETKKKESDLQDYLKKVKQDDPFYVTPDLKEIEKRTNEPSEMPDWKGPEEPVDPGIYADPGNIFPLGPKKPIGKVTAKFTKKKKK